MSHQRAVERNRRLQKLSRKTKHCYRGGAFYDDDKQRYVRVYLSKSGYARWIRKRAQRKVRRSDVHSHNHYRKVYDYWWELT